METINIKFGGLSNAPSDTMTSDNAIAASLGLVAHGDELIPVADPELVKNLIEGQKIEYIHTTAGKETYISSYKDGNTVKLYASEDGTIIPTGDNKDTPILSIDGIQKITSIGHILLVLDTVGDIHYVLWRNGEYNYLGTELPQLEVKASLDTTIFDPTRMLSQYGNVIEKDGDNQISTGAEDTNGLLAASTCKNLYNGTATSIALTGDTKVKVGQKVIGLIEQNRYLLRQNGLFTEPFYVRFAYRLYSGDPTIGNYVKHTPPILMVPNSHGKPLACVHIDENGLATLHPVLAGSSLYYEITDQDLDKWSDIIQSVDVFVTPAITDYTSDIEGVESLSVMPGHTRNSDGSWSINESQYPKMMTHDSEGLCLWENMYKKYNEEDKEYITETFSKAGGNQFYAPYKQDSHVRIAVNVASTENLQLVQVPSGIEVKPQKLTITADSENEYLLPVGIYYVYFLSKIIHGSRTAFVFNKDVEGYAIYGKYENANILKDDNFEVNINRVSGSYEEELVNFSNFYKIAEIPISEITEDRKQVIIEKNALLNLEAREELLDVGQGHTQYKSKEIVTYNSRLSALINEEATKPFTSVTIQNPHVFSKGSAKTFKKGYVEITENGQSVYAELEKEEINNSDIRVFFYPNKNATRLILFEFNGYIHYRYDIPLKRHRFLNAAYAFNQFDTITLLGKFTVISNAEEINLPTGSIYYTNKIITSSTSNPFHFPENLTCIVPTDDVKTISTTTKALSEGQFGQYPLYAFTNDGVWALSVSSDGQYIATQPATRDVCNNIDSITQSDTALYFTSDRGIIILAGSESLCISDILNDNGDIFDIKALPHWEKLTELCEATAEETQYVPFLEFVKGASLVYDYIHQRLYVYNPKKDYAYLYSLTFKKWTITRSNILAKVNSYPDALVNTKDHQYVNLCKDSDTIQKQFLITRPIKLSSPNSLKRIKTIIVHGNFKKGNVSCVLYGSRDMQNWHLIASRKTHEMRNICGTPYKYFRLVVISNLAKGETLSYATLEYESLYNNKLR